MSRSGIAAAIAIALSGTPAAAQTPSLADMKASFDGRWTLGPSQADNRWRCEDAPVRVTFAIDFQRNQTVATFENWPLRGSDTVFNVMHVVSIEKVDDFPKKEQFPTLILTPDQPAHRRFNRDSRYFRKTSDDVFVWGLIDPRTDRPMIFARCAAVGQ